MQTTLCTCNNDVKVVDRSRGTDTLTFCPSAPRRRSAQRRQRGRTDAQAGSHTDNIVYLPGNASELFSRSAFIFFFSLFFFLPSRFRRALWDGCDAMSTEEAIYSPFVLLRSFKKANSRRAWSGRGGWGG